MSEAFDQVMSKAVSDESFRKLLLTDPAKALEGFAVTPEERQMLEGLTEESLDDFAGGLGNRSTKGRWTTGIG